MKHAETPIVLSHVQVKPLLEARRRGQSRAMTSLDLGLTTCEVTLQPDRVVFSETQGLAWDSLEEVARKEIACFLVEENAAKKIQSFSEELNRQYSLMPTEAAPTLLVSGLPMHRIKGTEPYQDTLTKIRTIAPLAGRALDTATGLGYTAIEAAKTAEQVVTLEIDPEVLEVAFYNPWSRALFEDPKIQQIIGDAYEIVAELESEGFNRIVHDPPMFSLAGDLYSEEFYRQLFRVLCRGGRMFHYIGDRSSSSCQRVVTGVMSRLRAAGFQRVERRPEAFGLVAYK